MKKNEDLVKIVFPTPQSKYYAQERLWAAENGDGTYLVKNSPWDVFGLSWKDLVTAKPDETGDLVFQKVVKRGGHSTFRIRMSKGTSHEDFLELFAELMQLGCTYEQGYVEGDKSRFMYALDVKPGYDAEKVWKILTKHQETECCEVEKGYLAR